MIGRRNASLSDQSIEDVPLETETETETETATEAATGIVSRRGLLIGTSATGALLVGTYFGRGSLIRSVAKQFLIGAEATPPNGNAGEIAHEMWFEVPASGKVILYMPKAEMGQGIHTALAQIAAEDLELSVDQLDIRPVMLVTMPSGTISRGFGNLTSTAGSSSISGSYLPLRSAANTLKEMLLLEGANQLGAKRSEVEAFDGSVRVVKEPTNSTTYNAIVKNRKGALGSWSSPTTVPQLKAVRDFKVIGTNASRVDGLSKVTGTAIYGFDARVEGLHYGAIARPSRYGATLDKVEMNNVDKLPGVVAVVVDKATSFVGVVGTTRKRAYDALAQMGCSWKGGSSADDKSIFGQLDAATNGFDIHKQGDASGAINRLKATDIIEQQYYVPAVAHAHLEPLAATADVRDSEVHIWAATQQPQSVSNDVVGALKKRRNVVVHTTYLGGGFGRKFAINIASEAARLSEASGKPVQVALTRDEDMRMGPFRPPTLAKMRGAVANGRVVAVDQYTVSGSGDQQLQVIIKRFGADIAEPPGLISPYRGVANYRVKSTSLDLGVPTGIWRGVGLLPNSFANESFMDELAYEAKVDPLQFRIDHVEEDKVGNNYARLLKEVGRRSEWYEPLQPGEGRGVAAAAMAGTIVTAVAHVSVVNTEITVKHIYVCVDPGLVINPDGAKLQVAGGAMMSLSSALGEQMSFDQGMALNTNFDSYYLLSPDKAPPIDVHLMGSGDKPGGLGEPGVGPVCAALGNAIFAATGQRLRSLPFRLL
jgi:isoquinoline 1-oxidoreductase subunit beta